MRWYRRHGRDLPWRRTSDPYAIWVSEIMLQQTQVATVLPYYSRFLARYPDVATLSRAPEEQVLALWSGLGYYRRARALHAAAREVVDRHQGELPRDPDALRSLPGIGRYTAGAIASIAFGLSEPILDGNVRRVLARVLALDGDRLGRGEEQRQLWKAAAELACGPDPGTLNQGLMELGALVCSPSAPRCSECPLRGDCLALASGAPEAFPSLRPARATETVRVAVAWLTRAGRALLERPTDGNPLRGTWDLPAVELRRGGDPVEMLRQRFARRGFDTAFGPSVGTLRHGIMHRRLLLEVHAGRLVRGRVSGLRDLCWVDPAEVDSRAISGATRKVASLVAQRAKKGLVHAAPPSV